MSSSQPVTLSSQDSDVDLIVSQMNSTLELSMDDSVDSVDSVDSFDDPANDVVLPGPSLAARQALLRQVQQTYPRRTRTTRRPPSANAAIGLEFAARRAEWREKIRRNETTTEQSVAFRKDCRCGSMRKPNIPGYILRKPLYSVASRGGKVDGCIAMIRGRWHLCNVDFKNPNIPWVYYIDIVDLPYDLMACQIQSLVPYVTPFSFYDCCPMRCFKPSLTHVFQLINPAMVPYPPYRV